MCVCVCAHARTRPCVGSLIRSQLKDTGHPCRAAAQEDQTIHLLPNPRRSRSLKQRRAEVTEGQWSIGSSESLVVEMEEEDILCSGQLDHQLRSSGAQDVHTFLMYFVFIESNLNKICIFRQKKVKLGAQRDQELVKIC